MDSINKSFFSQIIANCEAENGGSSKKKTTNFLSLIPFNGHKNEQFRKSLRHNFTHTHNKLYSTLFVSYPMLLEHNPGYKS